MRFPVLRQALVVLAVVSLAGCKAYEAAPFDASAFEQQWLARTEAAVHSLRDWRYRESQGYGRPLAWRWALATTFALFATAAAGAGYVWAARPYAEEVAYLRSRNAFADELEARMVRMTAAERRQLEALLKLPGTKK